MVSGNDYYSMSIQISMMCRYRLRLNMLHNLNYRLNNQYQIYLILFIMD